MNIYHIAQGLKENRAFLSCLGSTKGNLKSRSVPWLCLNRAFLRVKTCVRDARGLRTGPGV